MSEAAERFRRQYGKKQEKKRMRRLLNNMLKSSRSSRSRKAAIKNKLVMLVARKPRQVTVLPPPCPGSNPIETLQATSVHEVNREFDCLRYDKCLDYADKNKWKGFRCNECTFHRTKENVDDKGTDTD